MEQPVRIELPTPFPVGPVNAWLLPGDEAALVDVGPRTDEAWAALVAGLRAQGLAPGDVLHLVITHAHIDHYGNARRLADAAPGLRLYAPDLAHARPMLLDEDEEWARQARFTERVLRASGVAEEIVAGAEQRLEFLRGFGCAVPVTDWIVAGQQLRFGAGEAWDVVALPGHSMTQIGLRQAEAGFLLAADHLLPRISSNALLEPPAPGEQRRPRALPRYIEALRWTAALPPHDIFPGHGLPFHDQRPLVARRLEGIEERAATLHALLAERSRAVIELVRALFPSLAPDQLFLAISEVGGHLDLLEARGQVAFRGEGVREYFVVEG